MGVNQRRVGQLGGCESRVIVEVIVKMQKMGGGVGWVDVKQVIVKMQKKIVKGGGGGSGSAVGGGG